MKFVVFAEDWGSHPSSTQHLFKLISQNHEVVWFNSVGMRTPKVNLKDSARVVRKLMMMLKKKQSSTPNMAVKNPLLLPWHNSALVCKFNRMQVAKNIDTSSDEPIIYWLSVPTAINMIHLRPQDKLVYYCGDDFNHLAGVDAELIQSSEKKLIHKADTIYVASKSLLNQMPAHKTQILEHGVDLTLFTQAQKKHEQLNGHENIIGFYGSLSSWLDYELLIKLAKSRPNYTLVLVGKRHLDIQALLAMPNVIHVNEVAHHELAKFSKHWHVSILPFVDNAQIRACNPLKLKEYLAVGTPIVSTRYPAVEAYSDVVFIAQDHQGFIDRVDHALCVSKSPSLNWRTKALELVKKHSWQNKVDYVLNQLASEGDIY